MPPFVAFAMWDKLVDFYEAGGPFMAPLTVCALVAVVVAFLRLRALRRERVLPRFVRNAIEKLPAGTDTGHIWQLVDENPAALARIARAGLLHMEMPRAENTGMVQTAARREIMRLEGGLGVLELIVGISPLLGLLGAISGLVGVFSNLGDTTTGQDTAGVALASRKRSTRRSSVWPSRSRRSSFTPRSTAGCRRWPWRWSR